MSNYAQQSISGAKRRSVAPPLSWTPQDLGEKLWYRWDSSTLADGKVSSWAERIVGLAATQSVAANQPTMSMAAGGVVYTKGSVQNLTFPVQSLAIRQFRAGALLFKAAPSQASSSSGILLAMNSYTGFIDNRQPMVGYNKTAGTYFIDWGNNLNARISVPKGNEGDWHLLAFRRVNGRACISFDGGLDTWSVEANLTLPRVISNAACYIGDYQPSSIPWTLKEFFLAQAELTDDEWLRLQGWGMWQVGAQARLRSDHPYFAAPPTSKPFTQPYQCNTAADWPNIIIPTWPDETHRGEPIAGIINGWEQVWIEDFDTNTITDDTTGAGPIYAPTQDTTGIATEQRPGGTPNVISQSGSNAVITMAKLNGVWNTTNLCTVNRDGRGHTWNPGERPTMFETKFRCFPDGEPMYPSFWSKDGTEFLWSTLTRIELDWLEAYRGNPGDSSNYQHHGSYHNWPARRLYAGRIASHVYKSNISGLTLASGWPYGTIDMFDGNYHTYGGLIDRNHLIYHCDGLEVFRVPSRPDMYRPMYCFLSLQVWNNSATAGSPRLEADYIRVYQGRY